MLWGWCCRSRDSLAPHCFGSSLMLSSDMQPPAQHTLSHFPLPLPLADSLSIAGATASDSEVKAMSIKAASINPSHIKSLLNTGCRLLPVQGLLLLGAITHHHTLSVRKLPHPAQSTDNLSREHGNFLEVYAALLDGCSQFFS